MNKKHLSVALSSLLVLPLLAPSGTPSTPTAFAADGPDQEVVIVYKNEDGKDAALEQSEEIRHEFETVPAVSAAVSPEELQDLAQNPDIAYIERNISFRTTNVEEMSTTPSANFDEQSRWNYQAVAPNMMWQQGFTGQGVKVAVIDSGISPHPELKIAGGMSSVGPGTNSDYADDNGHGTHVAGIIAADSGKGLVTGVAPGISLYGVKVLDSGGTGTLQDVLEGLDWAIQNDMNIINLSLGTPDDSKALHDMVDKAYNKGIVVVASAGNSGTASNINEDTVNYPAKYESVISVAAVDPNLDHAAFSSAGPRVDFSAPGVAIASTYPAALGYSYRGMSGTSQAAPHIAGELALLKEKNPSASPDVLRQLLKDYTVDLGDSGRDRLFGEGFVTFKSTTDTKATNEVSGADVISSTSDSLTLGWTLPADYDFKEVRVYNGSSIQPTTVTGVTYQATNLTPDTAYQFRLTTVDTAGNESLGVTVSGRTQLLPAENEIAQTPVQPTLSEPVPTPDAPPAVVQAPVTVTPAPSGGSAQIPSGGGGDGGVAPAPVVSAPAAVPTKPIVTPAPATTVKAPVALPFTDVAPTFWGRETVAWAYERGLVKGYGSGQLKPNATVTEAEFLAILIRAFEPQIKNAAAGTWSNTYYERAKQLNLPLKGYTSKTARSQNLMRVQVVEMLAAANGSSLTGNEAIRYVLSVGIAKGSSKTEKTVASFNGSRTLTRAEALQFVKNLTESSTGGLK
ncbi:S8 family serine peptidase [Saccharibacillus qingshengii]|uniref:S8 family serine peptidase n=1 Tax=Saccharibacillus qingshengii TaxID=1763540 RepID=UPI001552BB5D|nr:S8 family serine peptidase [Saccharibacillus qingshengii]